MLRPISCGRSFALVTTFFMMMSSALNVLGTTILPDNESTSVVVGPIGDYKVTTPSRVKLIITSGALIAGKYEEYRRFEIQVQDSSLIKEVLVEVRKNFPDRTYVERYGDYFYLVDPRSDEELHESKKVSDYCLKDGSTLRLFIRVR